MSQDPSKLVDFILEKERQEKAARRKKLLFGVGGFLLVASGIGVGTIISYGSTPPALASFNANELSLQRVASLLEDKPRGFIIENPDAGQKDTIKSISDYSMLVASLDGIEAHLPMNEAGEAMLSNNADAQTNQAAATNRPTVEDWSEPLRDADVMPSFPGGEAALYRFISKQIRYPAEAVEEKMEGAVYVRFIVQPDGTIDDVVVVKGIGFGCDEEAMRVVNRMPRWNPGQMGGRKVPVFSSLRINFRFL